MGNDWLDVLTRKAIAHSENPTGKLFALGLRTLDGVVQIRLEPQELRNKSYEEIKGIIEDRCNKLVLTKKERA